jgi:hypothetical protein
MTNELKDNPLGPQHCIQSGVIFELLDTLVDDLLFLL